MSARRRLPAGLAALAIAAGAAVLATGHGSSHAPAPTVAATAQQRVVSRRARLEQLAAQKDPVGALKSAWATEQDRAARLEILEAAARVPDPAGLQFLIEVASSADPLAAQAGAAIGRIASPRLTRELARVARADGSVLVRANAARALARSNGKDELDTLTSLVADPSTPLRVRQEAALAIGKLADDAATAALAATLDALAADPDAAMMQLRISIIQALGGIRSELSLAALRHHRERPLPSTERAFVDRALGAAPAA